MKLKTTIVLLILAGACVALFRWGPDLAPHLGLAPKPVATSDQGTYAALANLPVDQITKVEVESAGKTLLALHAPAPGQPLQLRGNWPIRRAEVDELLNTLRDLKSRYHPIPIDEKADLASYGLDDSQNPIIVEIARGKNIDVLRVGEAPAKAGDNPFTRPAYARLGETTQDEKEQASIEKRPARILNKNEVIRLGPQVLPILRRSEEVYRRRQLFPEAVRVRMADASAPRPGMEPPTTQGMSFLVSDAVKRIAVDMPAGRFVIKRIAPNPQPEVPADKPNSDPVVSPAKLAESWILIEPVRDRLDPSKLRSIITTIADIWVEQFQDAAQDQHYWLGLGANRNAVPRALAVLGGSIPTGVGGVPFGSMMAAVAFPDLQINVARVASTFNAPVESYKLTPEVFSRLAKETRVPESVIAKLKPLEGKEFTNADLFAAELGKAIGAGFEKWHWDIVSEARATASRTLQIGRVSRGSGDEEFRYAALEDNRFAFEIKSDKLNDLKINLTSPTPGSTDSPADDLRDPVLARFETGDVTGVEILASEDKGATAIKLNKAGSDWKMDQPVADAADRAEVDALLDLLKGWEARKGDILDAPIRLPILDRFGVAPIDPKTQLGLLDKQPKTITLTFEPKSGRAPATFRIGKHGGDNKRAVTLEGWDRVNLVRDGGEAQKASRVDYQPSQYRLVKLTDPGSNTISEIVVQRSATADHPADTFTLQPDADKLDHWLIVAPFKSETDNDAALALASGLRNLSSLRYVYDSKIDAPPVAADRWPKFSAGIGPFSTQLDLASDAFYGFDKPITVTVKFSKPEKAADLILEIGRARSNGDSFARVKGSTGIFTVPESIVSGANRKPEELADKTLINISGQDPNIIALKRLMGGQELEFSPKTPPEWEMLKPVAAMVDSTVVADLVKDLTKLKGSRIAEIGVKDLKKYGLEPPVATVTLEVVERNKSVEKTLLLGNPVNDKEPDGERYVKAQGSTTVAVIPGTLAKRLTANSNTFRDRTLGNGFQLADKIVIERGNRKITFAKSAGVWKVTEPLQTDAEDQDLRELYEAVAGKPKAEEIVEDKPKDLAKYGLDKPERIRFYNNDKEVFHLLLGSLEKVGMEKKIAGLRTYAMLDKGSTVFLLDWRLTHMLTAEYRKRDLWPPVQPDKVTEIAVKAVDPKDSFTLTKEPTGWSDPAKKGDVLNQPIVADLLFGIADARVDRFVVDKDATDLKPYGLDKPRTITITADGKKLTLLLGTMLDGKKLYAKVDDPKRTDVFLLSETDSKALSRPRAEYSVKKEEPKKEEPKKFEPKKEEPKKEEPKKDPDPKKEPEPKKEDEKK